jgi:hypothetical protein
MSDDMHYVQSWGSAFWWRCPVCDHVQFAEMVAVEDIHEAVEDLSYSDMEQLGIDPNNLDDGDLCTIPEVVTCAKCHTKCEMPGVKLEKDDDD